MFVIYIGFERFFIRFLVLQRTVEWIALRSFRIDLYIWVTEAVVLGRRSDERTHGVRSGTCDEFEQNAKTSEGKYEALKGLEDKIKELSKSDYAVKQSLTKEGYELYNEVLNKLQDSSDKSKLAANENAFIYARMAKSWARIRNEYGDTAYTAKDFMAEHRIKTNSKSEYEVIKAISEIIKNGL